MPGYMPQGAAIPTGFNADNLSRVPAATAEHFYRQLQDLLSFAKLPGDTLSGAQPTMETDPQTGEMRTSPSLMDRSAGLAGMMTLGAGAVPTEANALNMGIRAYHGSPHNFDQFDLSKIGTGEGAQSYGHGLYFAENPEVAGTYKHGSLFNQKFALQGAETQSAMEDRVRDLLGRHSNNFEAAKKDVDLMSRLGAPGYDTTFAQKEAQDILNKWQEAGVTVKLPGTMYEVDINAHPDEFLQYDRSLSEQPEKLRNFFDTLPEGGTGLPDDDIIGSNIYTSLADKIRHDRHTGYYNPTKIDAPSLASQELAQAGIPGIRYLDQGSRHIDAGKPWQVTFNSAGGGISQTTTHASKAAAEKAATELRLSGFAASVQNAKEMPTHNYVIFDPKIVTILRKYGYLPAAVGAGGAAAAMGGGVQPAKAEEN